MRRRRINDLEQLELVYTNAASEVRGDKDRERGERGQLICNAGFPALPMGNSRCYARVLQRPQNGA